MASGKETLTIAGTAVGLTASNYAVTTGRKDVDKVTLTLETAQIRYWVDGSTPTSALGHLMEVGETIVLENYDEVVNFRAIRTGSTSGVLSVTYEYKEN